MNISTVLFAFALLLCKTQAQICGPPILPPPLQTPVISNPPQIIPAPQLGTPVVGTTIIDNSLSSALANVLQLLIVSDLIESTLNTALGHHCVPLPNTICETIVPQPIVYSPTVEILSPIPEYIVPPCSPVIDFVPPRAPVIDVIPKHGPVCDFVPQFAPSIDVLPTCLPVIDFTPSSNTILDFVPQYGPIIDYLPQCSPVIDFIPSKAPVLDFVPQYGPVIDYKPCAPNFDFIPSSGPIIEFMPQISPVLEYMPACGPVFDYIPPCGTFVEPLPNIYGEYVPVSNYCGGVADFSYTPNVIGCSTEIIGPLQMAPIVPKCYNGLPEVISPRGNMGSLGTELLFPATVPTQVACNIGNIPTSLPCVSLNVESCPCGCGYGNNIITNPYFYSFES